MTYGERLVRKAKIWFRIQVTIGGFAVAGLVWLAIDTKQVMVANRVAAEQKTLAFKERCEASGGFVVVKYGGGLFSQPYDDCAFPPAKAVAP